MLMVTKAAYAAVKAGVRSIEHGTWLSEKTLRLMNSKGTWLVSNIFRRLGRAAYRKYFFDKPAKREFEETIHNVQDNPLFRNVELRARRELSRLNTH